jgi:hypothetical protein
MLEMKFSRDYHFCENLKENPRNFIFYLSLRRHRRRQGFTVTPKNGHLHYLSLRRHRRGKRFTVTSKNGHHRGAEVLGGHRKKLLHHRDQPEGFAEYLR